MCAVYLRNQRGRAEDAEPSLQLIMRRQALFTATRPRGAVAKMSLTVAGTLPACRGYANTLWLTRSRMQNAGHLQLANSFRTKAKQLAQDLLVVLT